MSLLIKNPGGGVDGLLTRDLYYEISRGNVPGHSIISKFGAGLLGTSIAPITAGSNYFTPSAPVQLEVRSTDARDAVGLAGLQGVDVEGLDGSWDELVQSVPLNGTTWVPVPVSLHRMYRWLGNGSNIYASQTQGSHYGELQIREVLTPANVWSLIGIAPFALGQSQIGVYSGARNKTHYLLNKNLFVDTTKTADVYFFRRTNADDVTPPYSGVMRLFEREVGVQGGYPMDGVKAKYLGQGPLDAGFMGTLPTVPAECSVEFQILSIDDGY